MINDYFSQNETQGAEIGQQEKVNILLEWNREE